MDKVTSKEKAKAAAATEKEVAASKKARVSMEKSSSELEAKLSETELKLAKAASLNIMRAEELANLKSALEGMTRVLSMQKTRWSPSSTKLGS